jgi:tRNA threonylcarbamoyladenosine biosynthesis protein TsaB
MKILALELSSARGSIAWKNENFETEQDWPNDRKDSGEFFKALAEIQNQFGTPDRIIVGVGPGSYAGTRIAISAAIGLSFGGTASVATPISLLGYPSICAIDSDETDYCVVGDARRQSFFFARIRDNNLVEGPDLLTQSAVREKIDNEQVPVFAVEDLPQFARVTIRYPAARLLARLAAEPNRRFVSPPLEPMYLREPHITTPKSA